MTKSQKAVLAAQVECKRLWILACEDEGIDPNSKFVVLTSVNGYSVAYNEAVKKFFALQKREKANLYRRERHATLKSLGLNRVVGAQGGVYYE